LRRLLAVPLIAFFTLAPLPGIAGAGTPVKSGQYNGKTSQQAVAPGFRQLQFKVKKGKVTLLTEPTVARDACLSTPVFTLDGSPTTKLKKRSFTFSQTFIGNKFDKIHGTFVSSNKVEGYALYHFQGQDLCSEGKSKVNFTAKHK
jgi:hypothetical protein